MLPDKPFNKLLQNIKKSGRSYPSHNRREHTIEVSVEDLKDIYRKQKELCYYSKKKIDLSEIFVPHSPKAISADRIDNSKSYSKDNIVLCMRFFNNGRNKGKMSDVEDILESNRGLLFKSRCYLVGSIEGMADAGISWRKDIRSRLTDLGITFLDPCDKPFVKDLSETLDHSNELKLLRQKGKYKKLAQKMEEIRHYDLRCVDVSDFLIFNFDPACLTCGSYEELTHANLQRKPVLFVCEKGIDKIPLWIFGMLPLELLFGSMNEAIEYLRKIDAGEIDSTDRWRFFKESFR